MRALRKIQSIGENGNFSIQVPKEFGKNRSDKIAVYSEC